MKLLGALVLALAVLLPACAVNMESIEADRQAIQAEVKPVPKLVQIGEPEPLPCQVQSYAIPFAMSDGSPIKVTDGVEAEGVVVIVRVVEKKPVPVAAIFFVGQEPVAAKVIMPDGSKLTMPIEVFMKVFPGGLCSLPGLSLEA